MAFPSKVIIIRHAEKPEGKSDNLSPVGFKRAEAFVKIFDLHPDLAENGPPDFIFAAKYLPGETSNRSYQTVAPLATSLNLAVATPFQTDDYAQLADEILSNPLYNNRFILIAWTHSNIPGLAKRLGSAPGNKWNPIVFDRMWVLRFDDKGRATSADLPQRLMPGDAN